MGNHRKMEGSEAARLGGGKESRFTGAVPLRMIEICASCPRNKVADTTREAHGNGCCAE